MKEVISDDNKMSEDFNDYFIKIAPNLTITTQLKSDKNLSRRTTQMLNSIKELQNFDIHIMIKTKKKILFSTSLSEPKINPLMQQNEIPF